MDGWWLFGWGLLWVLGVGVSLTWTLRGFPAEAPNYWVNRAIAFCVLVWPLVIAVQAAMTWSGKKWELDEPEERLCGCGPDHVAFAEWTPEEVAAGKKFRHRCCYKVTEERLRARAERRQGMVY